MINYKKLTTMIEYDEAEYKGEWMGSDLLWNYSENDDDDVPIIGGYENIIELEEWEVGGKSRHTLTLVTDEYVGEDRWESKYREDLFEQTPEQIIALVDEDHRAEVLQEIEQVFAKLKEISEAAA